MAEEAIRCPHCHSEAVVKYGRASNGKARYRCQQHGLPPLHLAALLTD